MKTNNKGSHTVVATEVDYRQLSKMQQAIFDSSPYSIISTSAEGTIRTVNVAALNMLGYAREELVDRHTPALFHDANEVAERAAELSLETGQTIEPGFEVFVHRARHGNPEEREWTYIRKDGSRIPIQLTVTPMHNEQGEINGFLGIAFDITERVLIKRKLKEQQERYRLLFEKAGDSIFLMRDELFIDCNSATLEMFGFTREQIIGQPPYRFSPEYQPDGQSSRTKALKKIKAAFNGQTQFFEWTHVRHDNTPFDAEVTLNLVEIDNEPHLLANVRDISMRKQAERELEDSRIQLMSQNESLRLINNLSNRLHGSDSVQTIAKETLNGIVEVTNTRYIAIYLVDTDEDVLRLTASNGFDDEALARGQTLSMKNTLSGLALEQGELLFSDDFSSDERLDPEIRQSLLSSGIKSGVSIPLIYQKQKLGCINLVYTTHRRFTTLEKETLEVMRNTVSQSIANARQLNELEHMALHDSLTGLPNRSCFHREFDERVKQSRFDKAILLLLDLDRFKEVNDTLGHHIGDKLLQKIGPCLQEMVASRNSIISRLGGDEFTVFIEAVDDQDTAMSLAKDLLDRIRQPFTIGEMTLEIDASIGIARYPEDGTDSHALLRSADVAMYEAKNAGGGICSYDSKQDKNTLERLTLIAELNRAIRDRRLTLHYQPKMDLDTGEVCGFEALVRWQHDNLGLLYPDAFVPLAELGDSIHQLTETVIDLALEQQRQWDENGLKLPVAVNISARNLIDERCTRVIRNLLEKHATEPGMLELEITETALMADPKMALQQLNRIAALGVRLAIDDFGTGYSSLSYLRQMPIEALKIDRVFVRDLTSNQNDTIIVNSTIVLAHNLGIKVIAEGVEEVQALDMLKSMGCDMVQGYAVSKPAAWPDIERWLRQQ